MQHDTSTVIHDALLQPIAAIPYHLGERLRSLFPDMAIVEGGDRSFELESYAAAGECALKARPGPYPQSDSGWAGPSCGVMRHARNLWYGVEWRGEQLDVLLVSWDGSMGEGYRHYIMAGTQALADSFLGEVCRWSTELRDEVLVFEAGHWHKDAALFHAIKGATLDNLVLRGSLKGDIHDDLAGFFDARETYERYGVPWKRGVLLVGPPGNGKTHAVKALVNALGQDCLYVKSFRSQMPDEYSIHTVFAHARMSAPCILVLEDLDSLITPRNRSFFLNELDGFAGNEGILTLATTNHPERLDPAIVDRPSRFDRKYPFDLPGTEARAVYIEMWNQTLQPELQLSQEGVTAIAERTENFSFAYLKELFVSATMGWIHAATPGAMDDVMAEQVVVLREQMASAITFEPLPDDEMDPHPSMMSQMVMHGPPGRGWVSRLGVGWDDEEME